MKKINISIDNLVDNLELLMKSNNTDQTYISIRIKLKNIYNKISKT